MQVTKSSILSGGGNAFQKIREKSKTYGKPEEQEERGQSRDLKEQIKHANSEQKEKGGW